VARRVSLQELNRDLELCNHPPQKPGNLADRREIQAVTFDPVITRRLRVLPLAVRSGKKVVDSTMEIWEIEAYGPETKAK